MADPKLKQAIEDFEDAMGESWVHHIFFNSWGGDPKMPFEFKDIKGYYDYSNVKMQSDLEIFAKHGVLPKAELDKADWSIEWAGASPTPEEDVREEAARDLWVTIRDNANKHLDSFAAAYQEIWGESLEFGLQEILIDNDEDEEV